ncbi:MAG: DUF5343 domain-containing protein [Mesorhizobium sp.]|nr:DUF5343 domain-containing protein [Mesorhizobium sp.]
MSILNQPTQVYAQLPKFFETLRAGTAPPTFNRQFLKDVGFKSSNHHAFIPLLKGLGFLTSDGTPTDRYKEFLDGSKWRKVIGTAVAEAYGDIFVIKAKPTTSDLKAISGKFKSTFNQSDMQAERNARTFLALWELADQEAVAPSKLLSPPDADMPPEAPPTPTPTPLPNGVNAVSGVTNPPTFHYNIQIHLPATKDVEVYNAIFKSLRSHLID